MNTPIQPTTLTGLIKGNHTIEGDLPDDVEVVTLPECTAHVMHTEPCELHGITEDDICEGCGTWECFDTWRCSE